MSDLVARLYDAARESGYPKCVLYDEASVAIGTLQHENAELRELIKHYADQSGVTPEELNRVHNI